MISFPLIPLIKNSAQNVSVIQAIIRTHFPSGETLFKQSIDRKLYFDRNSNIQKLIASEISSNAFGYCFLMTKEFIY